jgi:hypothetical protein
LTAGGIHLRVSTFSLSIGVVFRRSQKTNVAEDEETSMKKYLEAQAIEALRAMLHEVSGIKLKEIRTMAPRHSAGANFIANIDIFGHSRVLACKVKESSRPVRVKQALKDLLKHVNDDPRDMTPILIAPTLSAEAQAQCRESNAGFLDLAGNARLVLNEVFIAKRSMPHREQLPPSAESLPTSETARFAEVA